MAVSLSIVKTLSQVKIVKYSEAWVSAHQLTKKEMDQLQAIEATSD